MDESHNNEKEISAKSSLTQSKIEDMKNEILSLKEKKAELELEVEQQNKKFENSLNAEDINEVLCVRCRDRISSD